MENKEIQEKELNPKSGGVMLLLFLAELVLSIVAIVIGAIKCSKAYPEEVSSLGVVLIVTGAVLFIAFFFLICGLRVVHPNEALVLTLFGNYYGTIKKAGFFFVNPFAAAMNPAYRAATQAAAQAAQSTGKNQSSQAYVATSKLISTKVTTLNNEKQKVNDKIGNPIIIGAVVIWRVADPTKAVFNVENFVQYLSTQCDSTIRNIARLYPYDIVGDDADEKTLRGSSQEIADSMKVELQERVLNAGLEIEEVRITHLSYAEEIAAAMLQRQQAEAIIAARQKIVEGAVSMVKMAIDELGEEEIVLLDEERKAAMVSNLLVVLCGNKDAQPIVNSGSIY